MPENAVDIVVAGHICLDLIPELEEHHRGANLLVPGSMNFIGPMTTSNGGAVANTGLALHRLGVSTSLMGKVGEDILGRATLDIIRQYDPALADAMIITKDEASAYTVVLNPPGADRNFLHFPGPNDTFCADDVDYASLKGVKVFHFGYPTLMKAMYSDGGGQLERMFRAAKEHGVTTSMDMSTPDLNTEAGRLDWESMLKRVLPYVDIYLPSLPETMLMLDRDRFEKLMGELNTPEITPLATGADLHRLGERLIELGVAVAGLKLGDQGFYLRTTNDENRIAAMGSGAPEDPAAWFGQEFLAPCFAVDVAGTVGAGDCTIAGFLAGLLSGESPCGAATIAVATGACCVSEPGAITGIVPLDEIRKRIASGWPRKEVSLALDGWTWDDAAGIWRAVG